MYKLILLVASVSLVLLWTLTGCGDDYGHHGHDGASDHHESHGDHDPGEHQDEADKPSPED